VIPGAVEGVMASDLGRRVLAAEELLAVAMLVAQYGDQVCQYAAQWVAGRWSDQTRQRRRRAGAGGVGQSPGRVT